MQYLHALRQVQECNRLMWALEAEHNTKMRKLKAAKNDALNVLAFYDSDLDM